MADPGTGTVWLGFADAGAAAQTLPALDAIAAGAGGHRLIARAPLAMKDAGDVWAPPPAARALEIMRGLKQAFDPHHILSPGRFVAGL
jgi:glycolate oxidase FAD binding subunit